MFDDISEPTTAVDQLVDRSLKALQARWSALTGVSLKGARRDLLEHALAYKLQEQQVGGLSAKTRHRLAQLAKNYTKDRGAQPQIAPDLKPGCRLLREWQGVMHEVTVLEAGFQHGDRIYRSLSQIARTITGTRWSGPLFFGLKRSTASLKRRTDI